MSSARDGGLPQGNFWFAEYDEAHSLAGFRWTPCLQMEGLTFTGNSWFATAEACEEFIRDEILGAAAVFEKTAPPMIVQPEAISEADAAELKRRFIAAQHSGEPPRLLTSDDGDDPRPKEG